MEQPYHRPESRKGLLCSSNIRTDSTTMSEAAWIVCTAIIITASIGTASNRRTVTIVIPTTKLDTGKDESEKLEKTIQSHWIQQWLWLVFSDKSRFCVCPHVWRIRVWSHRLERKCYDCILYHHTSHVYVIIVWDTHKNGHMTKTPFICVVGSVNSQRYIFQILGQVVVPCIRGLGDVILQNYNRKPYVVCVLTSSTHRVFNCFPG